MREELCALLPLLAPARTVEIGGRHLYIGELQGREVILVLSGIGKVAAATTATLLIQTFNASALVFTGVAGGLHADVSVGDVVIAHQLLQHDMDASPIFPRFEVPLTGRSHFDASPALGASLAAAAQRCLRADMGFVGSPELAAFGIHAPRVHRGLIVSGDRFVSTSTESAALRGLLPAALAVEMEGAALAQVCFDFDRPYAVLRTISDRADDNATVDFQAFIADVASAYTRAIVLDWLAASA